MNSDHSFERLLHLARDAYVSNPDLTAFAPFPDDVRRQEIAPYHLPCGDVLRRERGLLSRNHGPLQEAIVAAAPHVIWRETYKGTDIGARFMDNFGCFSIIGKGGPFASEKLWLWVVYMPPGLYYPWHHHPAEEIYAVIGGAARFMRKGMADEVMGEGDTAFHASNQPHAMETGTDPVLCLVAWRNGFGTPPVLTPGT